MTTIIGIRGQLALGMLVLLVLSSVTALAWAARASAQGEAATNDPLTLRELYYVALNAGDVAWVMSLYADDATYEGIGSCRLQPCVGRAAIEREIARQVEDQAFVVLLDGQAEGDTARGRWEADATRVRLAGVERVTGTDVVTVRAGRIVANRVTYDSNDPQTARLLEWLTTPR